MCDTLYNRYQAHIEKKIYVVIFIRQKFIFK